MPRGERRACGYSIVPQPHIVCSDPPATVYIHRLGYADSLWLTPAETRALAQALLEAAAEAEED